MEKLACQSDESSTSARLAEMFKRPRWRSGTHPNVSRGLFVSRKACVSTHITPQPWVLTHSASIYDFFRMQEIISTYIDPAIRLWAQGT